jgi:hypothetical protein
MTSAAMVSATAQTTAKADVSRWFLHRYMQLHGCLACTWMFDMTAPPYQQVQGTADVCHQQTRCCTREFECSPSLPTCKQPPLLGVAVKVATCSKTPMSDTAGPAVAPLMEAVQALQQHHDTRTTHSSVPSSASSAENTTHGSCPGIDSLSHLQRRRR